MRNIIVLFLFLLVGKLYSQCELHTDNGIYKATCFKSLVSDNGNFIGGPDISIAKNGSSGFFILKLDSGGSHFGLQGNVIVYLDDNSKITLVDRNINWKVNGELFCQYILTTSEISKLKKTNIKAVRYWPYYMDGAAEYYNKSSMYTGLLSHEKVDFPKLISELYEK